MKKRSTIRIILVTVGVIICSLLLTTIYIHNHQPSTVRAYGDLTVDCHTPHPHDPIFIVTDFKPGDCEVRTIDVKNHGDLAGKVYVKGVKTGPSNEDDPYKLEGISDLSILNSSSLLYGKKLKDFFLDSNPNGVELLTINPGKSKTFIFKVCFPSSAGNEYQEKRLVFDLEFGVHASDNLVINEVYYNVDSGHGTDSPKDCGNGDCRNICFGKYNYPGCRSFKYDSFNGFFGSCRDLINPPKCNNNGQNDEWLEIYNPTDNDISLKDWSLTDNSGDKVIIHANKIVKKGGFALLSKDASSWKYWNENPSAMLVELGQQIGDGLGDKGDRLYLKNSKGKIIDSVAWGDDKMIWNPAVPNSPEGSSIERITPGFDYNFASDWLPRTPPTPGN